MQKNPIAFKKIHDRLSKFGDYMKKMVKQIHVKLKNKKNIDKAK